MEDWQETQGQCAVQTRATSMRATTRDDRDSNQQRQRSRRGAAIVIAIDKVMGAAGKNYRALSVAFNSLVM